MLAKACAQRFDDGLFGGKAPCKVGNRIFVFQTVVLFFCREQPREQPQSVRIDAFADPFDLNDIVANP